VLYVLRNGRCVSCKYGRWAMIERDAGGWKRVEWDGWKCIRNWDAVEPSRSRISDSAETDTEPRSRRYSSSNPLGRCWPHFLCSGHLSRAMYLPVPCRPACLTWVFPRRWSSGYCFYCISQLPTSDTDPSSADTLVRMYRWGGNGRLGREERGKGSDSCRRHGRNADNDADVQKGKRFSGK